MLDAGMLNIILGVSSFLGFSGLACYFFFLQNNQVEQSVRSVIEGEGLFNADQIIKILDQFKDDASRLTALVELTKLDSQKASNLLKKVNATIDVNELHSKKIDLRKYVLLVSSIFFIAIAAVAFISDYSNKKPVESSGPRFDVNFKDVVFTKVDDKVHLQVTLIVKDNHEYGSIFVGLMSIHDESRYLLGDPYKDKTCEETPSCLSSKVVINQPDHPVLIRGGVSNPTELSYVFRIPTEVKLIRIYWVFYQKEHSHNLSCTFDEVKQYPKGGIPYLKVVNRKGEYVSNKCWMASGRKTISINL